MSHSARGLVFIINERQDEWRRQAAGDRRATYARPDAAPDSTSAADIKEAPRRRVTLADLRRRIAGALAEA